jgi:NifB/MoaA-like Fe-S oxidoreductase
MRAVRGVGWVYAADEFYLRAGVAVPQAEAYDDFPQFENGIGMVRSFLDEFRPGQALAVPATVVTGELFAPVLRDALDRVGFDAVRVLPVANRLFGGNVSVTGLLGGQELLDAIAADAGPEPFLVPEVVVNSDGLLLDDVPARELEARSGRTVRIIGSDGAALAAVLTRPESQAHTR